VLGIGTLGVNAVMSNQADHATLLRSVDANLKQIETNTLLLRAEVDAKIAKMPPQEYRDKVSILETNQMLQGKQIAQFEVMFKNQETQLFEIKSLLISMDKKQHTN